MEMNLFDNYIIFFILLGSKNGVNEKRKGKKNIANDIEHDIENEPFSIYFNKLCSLSSGLKA